MCVWQAVLAKDVFAESGVKRITVMSVTENFKSLANVRYSESKFQELFKEAKVDFKAYKDYALNWLKAPSAPFNMVLDEIETACWGMCRGIYESEALNTDDIERLWYMFNRLCVPGTYPPTASVSDVDWFFTMVAKNLNKTWKSKDSLPAGGVGFQEMINILDKTYFTVTSSLAVRDCIVDLYDWMVREVMKAGWLHKRTKKQSNWTNWLKRWFVMTPGKLTYYENDKEKNVKGEVLIDGNATVETLDAFKGLFNKMENRFRVRPGPYLEMEMNAESLKEKQEWLRQLQNNIESMRTGITPVMRLLMERNTLETTKSPTDEKIEESLKLTRAATKHLRNKPKEAGKGDENANTTKKEETRMPPLPPPIEDEMELYDNNAEKVQKDKIQAVFHRIDTDGNGKIDTTEFYQFIKGLGADVQERETKLIFDTVDKDKNGFILFDEFYDFFMKLLLGQIGDTAAEARLRAAFMKADRDESGAVNFREFAEYALSKRRSMAMSKLLEAFDEMDLEGTGEIGFDSFRQFFAKQMSVNEEGDKSQLEDYLKQFYSKADSREMAQYLRQRWNKFATFRRVGAKGEVVMKGGHGMVADVVPGEYDLLELACFNDLPPIIPKHVVVKATWTPSTVPGKSGRCLFPTDFDGVLPIEVATNGHLAYYGASLVDGQQLKISLLYRHGIQDFTYENSYLSDYVTDERALGGAGIERHEFHHLDCPIEEDAGYFVMGKMVDDELHLTGFKVPTRHTLYVPAGVIHSNDYLKGTWRTMLSDEADIDHVQLVKAKREGNMESYEHFIFSFK
jgi:Ca2+-binding EF-hand superfamily protein